MFRERTEVPGQVPVRVQPNQRVGTVRAGLMSGVRKVQAGRKFRGPDGPGQVPGWFWDNLRVGTPRPVWVVGGWKFWGGRRFRGPEVPGHGRKFRSGQRVDANSFFFSSRFHGCAM